MSAHQGAKHSIRNDADATAMAGRQPPSCDCHRPEPRFEDMLGDPVFLTLMASDSIPMDGFLRLVTSVRQKLETAETGVVNICDLLY
jgi:hypothetical protein